MANFSLALRDYNTRLQLDQARFTADLENLDRKRRSLFDRGAHENSLTLQRSYARQIQTVDDQIKAVEKLLVFIEKKLQLFARIIYAQEAADLLSSNPLAGIDFSKVIASLNQDSLAHQVHLGALLNVLEERGQEKGEKSHPVPDKAAHKPELAQVRSIPDGDGVNLVGGTRVRYIGINAPEMRNWQGGCDPFAEEAKAYNAKLLEGKKLRLVFDTSDTDPYGRLLRYVYAGPLFVNAEMVRAGFATTMTVPPNVAHATEFARLEAEARHARRGMWKDA